MLQYVDGGRPRLFSLGAVWNGGEGVGRGPGVDPYCWLGVGWRGEEGLRGELETSPTKGEGSGSGGVTVHFPCRLGGSESFRCTPHTGRDGSSLIFKPPSWCLVHF